MADKRGLPVYEAALEVGYSDRHVRRPEWWPARWLYSRGAQQPCLPHKRGGECRPGLTNSPPQTRRESCDRTPKRSM